MLIRAAAPWHGIRIIEFEHGWLKAIRGEINEDFTACNATSAPNRI